jgi:hypothetical protein
MIVYLFSLLCVLPYLCGFWFFSLFVSQALPFDGSTVQENKGLNKEEVENVEAPSDKKLVALGGPGDAEKEVDYFLCPQGLELLTIPSACSATSAVRLLFQCTVGVSRSETEAQLRNEPATMRRHPTQRLNPAATWR